MKHRMVIFSETAPVSHHFLEWILNISPEAQYPCLIVCCEELSDTYNIFNELCTVYFISSYYI